MVLKWFCFILVCLDTVAYIINQADKIKSYNGTASKVSGCIGLFVGIAARVYVLYGAGTCWLAN